MTVKVWTAEEFLGEIYKREQLELGENPPHERIIASREYQEALSNLVQRAHSRGDGVAVFVNNDLGHIDVGQIQVVSYGSDQAQLPTRHKGYPDGVQTFSHGDDVLSMVLPDIGGRINYRYLLEAVVPAPSTHDRLVTLTVKVSGGATEEEASAIVRAIVGNGLEQWNFTAGKAGFSDQDDTGIDTYDRGIRAEVIDAAVI